MSQRHARASLFVGVVSVVAFAVLAVAVVLSAPYSRSVLLQTRVSAVHTQSRVAQLIVGEAKHAAATRAGVKEERHVLAVPSKEKKRAKNTVQQIKFHENLELADVTQQLKKTKEMEAKVRRKVEDAEKKNAAAKHAMKEAIEQQELAKVTKHLRQVKAAEVRVLNKVEGKEELAETKLRFDTKEDEEEAAERLKLGKAQLHSNHEREMLRLDKHDLYVKNNTAAIDQERRQVEAQLEGDAGDGVQDLHRREVVKGPSGYKRVGAKSQKTLMQETQLSAQVPAVKHENWYKRLGLVDFVVKKTKLSTFSAVQKDWRARLGLVDP